MGWNSGNRFQTRIDERLMRETAEAIVLSSRRGHSATVPPHGAAMRRSIAEMGR